MPRHEIFRMPVRQYVPNCGSMAFGKDFGKIALRRSCQVVKILRGSGVEAKSPRKCAHYLSGRAGGTALLESQVVSRADARQRCQLLATQSRNTSSLSCRQPDVFGKQTLAPRSKVLTKRAGLVCHASIVRLSPPIPPLIGNGCRSVCRNSWRMPCADGA